MRPPGGADSLLLLVLGQWSRQVLPLVWRRIYSDGGIGPRHYAPARRSVKGRDSKEAEVDGRRRKRCALGTRPETARLVDARHLRSLRISATAGLESRRSLHPLRP